MKRTYLFLAAALALAACSNDDDFSKPAADDGRVAVSFAGGITMSRAINDAWQSGDGIGIYMLESGTLTVADKAANRRYTTPSAAGNFTPADEQQTIYFPLDEADKVDFIAYYPQSALTADSYAVDVTDQSAPSAIDLLWSNNATAKDKTVQTVNLEFRHRLSRVEVELNAGTGVDAAELAGAAIALTGQPLKADFDVLQNTLATTGEPGRIALLTAADGRTASAIILPQESLSGRSLAFTLADGSSLAWPIEESRTFEQGMKTVFRITLHRTQLGGPEVEVTATIEPWGLQGTVDGDIEIQ